MDFPIPLPDYPPGLIEIGGTMITQSALILAFGIYYFTRAPDTEYKKVLLLPVGTLIQNFLIIHTIHIIALSLISSCLGSKVLEFSFFEITTNLPTSDRLLHEFISAIFIFEILFYTGHRLMHHPRLYKLAHKQHHRFEQEHLEQVPFAVFYAHPIEAVFVYSLVVVAAAVQHSLVISFWLSGAVVTSSMMYMYTGEDIAGIMSRDSHRVHPKFNFGAVGILDWISGTLYASRGFAGLFKKRV